LVPFDQRWGVFVKNLPGLADNLEKSLLMFNWKGDRGWFHGEPNGIPALDFFAGALFVIGLGILGVRYWKRRDPVDLLLPIAIVIMVLPSALAIAFTVEVPDFTRASGAFPMVYFIAGLALAFLLQLALHYLPSAPLRRFTVGLAVVLLALGAVQNYNSYFVEAMSNYRQSTLPHQQAGQILKGFINSSGAPGNAFMIAYPYWMDDRAIGIEAGDVHWDNTVAKTDDFPQHLYIAMQRKVDTPYELRPDRQMLFFLNQDDTAMTMNLTKLFPGGSLIKVPAYNSTRDFNIYIAPPPGCDWITTNVGIVPQACAYEIVQPGSPDVLPAVVPTPPGNDTGSTP